MDLLVTDLDGTLLGTSSEVSLFTSFRDHLLERRKRHNTVWVICTGRHLDGFKRAMIPMGGLGIIAEYVILNHAQIYELTRFGYMPHLIWNYSIRWRIRQEGLRLSKVIDEWYELIMTTVRRVRITNKDKRNLRMRFVYEADVNAAMTLLEPLVKKHQNLQLFRYRLEIDIRPIPFTKGLAVLELAQHLGIGSEATLTIGDGYNDISMLDPQVAHRTGCPANAEPQVMQVVHRHGGHIASQQALAGVIEIMECYEAGTISSALPDTWQDPTLVTNPRHWKKQDKKEGNIWIKPLCILFISYVVLLALASGKMLFGLSPIILKPYTALFAKLGHWVADRGW